MFVHVQLLRIEWVLFARTWDHVLRQEPLRGGHTEQNGEGMFLG